MDAARTAKRSGSRATIIYRKGMENMTASKKEIAEAEEDGVEFLLHHSPVEITDDGIILKKQEEGQPEEEVFFKADSIIVAISQNPRANIVSNTTDLDTNNLGLLLTDEKGHTTKEGTFASGDVVTGAKTVVEAVHQAKIVAEEMEAYCEAKKNMTKTAAESAS
jgi:possible glutamate synthase (NADPH)